MLFEHQSAPDPWLALRLLRYMVRIWEAQIQADPSAAKLPVILPVVLAQNADVWSVEPHLGALLDLPDNVGAAFAPYVPEFTFRLCQLAEMGFESIRGTASGILILRTMKAERLAQLLHEAVWDESLLGQFRAKFLNWCCGTFWIRILTRPPSRIGCMRFKIHKPAPTPCP